MTMRSAIKYRLAAGTVLAGVAFVGLCWSVGLDPLTGRMTLSDIVVATPDATIHIGRVSFYSGYALTTPAHAAENVSFKDLSVDAGGLTYTAPSLDIAGSSLTQRDFAAVQARTGQPFAARLATFAAASVVAPQVTVERVVNGQKQTIVLRNFAIRNVAAGKAATVTAESGTLKGPPPTDVAFGPVNGRTLDLALLAKLASEKPAPEPQPKPLFASFTMDKATFKTPQGTAITIGRLSSTNAKAQPGDQPQHLLTYLGQLTASDSIIDLVRAGAPNQRWTLKELSVLADDPREGIPTKYRITLDGLSVPTSTSDPQTKNLADLGIAALTISAKADGEWMPQASEFNVRQFNLDVDNVGAITLRGNLGKVTKETFVADNSGARFKEATLKTASVVIENKGLYERIVMREAKKRNKSLEDMRKELAAANMLATINMMDSQPDTNVVKTAVLRFVSKPGKLSVSIKSKSPAGVPLNELGSQASAAASASKFEVVATAE
ncbi:MAG: hypothetical protein JOZ70_03635 [Pseudolabrys sp.]|nr:hypothetical protein [Pseudolabrys sp.]MBV9954322.1 hypothetical protein [Pseudolabrys sp.]